MLKLPLISFKATCYCYFKVTFLFLREILDFKDS